jgi:hypothetical protein
MKEFAVQKQLVPVDNGTDPNWAKRQMKHNLKEMS